MDGLSARSLARASSGDVQKIRTNLQAQITNLRKERGNASYTALFESIEQTLSQLRLACMQVIFHDFEYAADKKIEHILWQAHTSVNGEYRKVAGRLGVQSQVVQKRKVERMYKDFLKTSQSFYCGYIQRLAGRFFIPELRQAAQGLNLQPTDMPSRDASPPDSVCKLVANSCQTSLVHLGDLARYRCHISDKSTKSSFDTALAYYGLANAVDPDNGSAHHQMAVLYQIQALHFEIVYHFHRAIAIAKPHELGLGNLEREFRGLQNPVPAQARGSADAMVAWFVHLHGFYFQGEPFALQPELEIEVLHRSERAYAADDQAKTLLKMALINLASYDIATAKVKESWTSNASRTCQFLLRWAVRSIAVLLRLIKAELQAEPVTVPAQNALGATESPLVFNESLSKLLRFLRIYIAWIYTVRSDIVQYRDFLEPHISEVYRLLADSLTLLNTYAYQCSDTIHSQYLLPEDIEAVGLQPLNDSKLPLFLRVEDTTDTQPTKRRKTRKSRKEALGLSYCEDTETVWRIRDIVYCGILLAGSAHFPVSITVVKYPDGRKVEGWVFTDEHPAESYISEIEMSRMLDRLEANNLNSVFDKQAEQAPQLGIMGTEAVSIPAVTARNDKITALSSEDRALSLTHESRPSGSVGEIDISQDNEMVDMVNKLLDPLDNSMSKESNPLGDTSYGMSASTANEVFGQLGLSSGQPSPVAKAIPNLPWGNFYNANWNETSAPGQGVSSNAHNYIARASVGGHEAIGECRGGVAVSQLLPGGGYISIKPNTERSRIPSVSRRTAPQKRSPSEEIQPASNEGSRNAVLESLAQALYAQHGLSSSHPDPHYAPASPSWPAGGAVLHDTGDRITGPHAHCGSDTLLQPPQALIGASAARDATNAPIHTQGMYHSGSGLFSGNPVEPLQSDGNFSPSVISDGHARRIGSLSNGISHGGSPSGLGLSSIGRLGIHPSPWNNGSPMTAASSSFSHPSSLFASTPHAIAVPRTGVGSPSRNASLPASMFYPSEGLFNPSGSAQAQAPTRLGPGDVRYNIRSSGHSPR